MNRPWDTLSPDERARRVREYLARHHASCPRCGYDLHGLDAPTCPECGLALNERMFSFLAPDRDEQYEAQRLHRYVAANRCECPECRRPLDRVNGRNCPHCSHLLEVWMLMPRGLPQRRRGRWTWTLLITLVYVAIAAGVGILGLWTRPR